MLLTAHLEEDSLLRNASGSELGTARYHQRKQQYLGYEAKQLNMIIDVLGGWTVQLEETLKDLVGQRSRSVLRRMQKVILSDSLNIARALKF